MSLLDTPVAPKESGCRRLVRQMSRSGVAHAYAEIRAAHAEGESAVSIARRYGVTRERIYQIVRASEGCASGKHERG